MSQNLPPNQPGQPGGYPDDNAQSANPYYSAQGNAVPDLDASAPQLQTEDTQKLNKKALYFLGGIVLLLILMTVLVLFRSDSDEDQKPVEKPKEEKVVIPKLPEAPPEPIPLDPLPPPPPPTDLPPLPPEDNFAEDNARGPSRARNEEPSGPTLLQRRMGVGDSGSSFPFDGGAGAGDGTQGDPFGADGGDPNATQQSRTQRGRQAAFINKPDTLLVRGTYIRCILETRIITDFPGFTSCIVTEPVYSINGRSLLLPKGTKVSGTYSGTPTGPRTAVIWDRITTPTGIDVSISSPGVDNLGSAGHPGDFNAHWASRVTSALLISLISDAFEYAAAKNGPPTTTVTDGGTIIETPFESNTARTVERLAQDAIARGAARPATVTINQGTLLNIYVAEDVDFSAVVGSRR